MASRFWVGGTGTWDASSTTHWAASSGGASGASVPGASDTVTFDNNSGAGTVTVATDINIQSLTLSANSGQTLDFSANNNNVTIGTFTSTGAGTRTLNMGNGTWTITGTAGNVWDAGGGVLTLNANSSVLTFSATSASSRTMTATAAKTYATVNVPANTAGGSFTIAGAPTIGTLNITGPNYVRFTNSTTTTISNFSVSGSSTGQLLMESTSPSAAATVSVSSGTVTPQWAAIRGLTFSGGATFTASSSFDLGQNSGITINPPSGGGHVASRQQLGM
ncbi:hypothetical protein [Mesorhizobium sp.]|uniref:hypothetical protein n=1 Tax=Mesorhizobium sp. TaxID=1871066 RepID=UPI00120C7E02|nr:hypothetical protein [Mesorhizobium sp.]TIN84349.1 MAG: hypothetical protein E5X97_22540 [Mesorhizobium sp.]